LRLRNINSGHSVTGVILSAGRVAMNKSQILGLLVIAPLFPYPCFGQGMGEYGGAQAGVAGLGAGLAASLNHGKMVRHSYQAVINAQQVLVMQTKAIEQYMKVGCEQETKKKWAAAEESFRYVLTVIARRDGPGSSKGLPALEHLVSVAKAQDKIEDAISYQKTVIAFEKSAPSQNVSAIVKAQNNLSNLFVTRGDYASAEPFLRDSVAICNTHRSSLSSSQRHNTVISYSKVLRKLKKNAEAETLEAEDKKLEDQDNKILAEDMKFEDPEDKTLAETKKNAPITDLGGAAKTEQSVPTGKAEQSVPSVTITPKADQH